MAALVAIIVDVVDKLVSAIQHPGKVACCSGSKLVDFRLSPLFNRGLVSRTIGDSNEENGNDGGSSNTPVFKCEASGLQCKDCSTVINCLDMSGDFLEIETAKCNSGETCNNGTCSLEANHQCGGLSKVGFECKAVGMFPNPADCQKFYVCIQEVPNVKKYKAFEGKCDNDRVYDMTTTYCNLKLSADKQCPLVTKVPTCETPGQTFVLVNKSIFGMCLRVPVPSTNDQVLVPRLYLCPNGGIYTPATYKCT